MKIRTISHPKDKKHLKSKIMSLIRELIVLRDGEKCLRCGKTEHLQMSHNPLQISEQRRQVGEEDKETQTRIASGGGIVAEGGGRTMRQVYSIMCHLRSLLGVF